jgi:outer membrane biogenesis lipoprotein LolB
MFALAKHSKARRLIVTAIATAALATCTVAVSTHESATPTSAQLASGPTMVTTDDGFHW